MSSPETPARSPTRTYIPLAADELYLTIEKPCFESLSKSNDGIVGKICAIRAGELDMSFSPRQATIHDTEENERKKVQKI